MVVTEGLTKRFKKEKRKKEYIDALRGISFRISEGEIFGIMGPNGAGKTTLLKILSCVLRPDSGDAWVNGHHVIRDRRMAKASSNLVVGGSWIGLNYAYTVRENLKFFGKLFGIPRGELERRIEEAIRLFYLGDIIDKESLFLSSGQIYKAVLGKILLIRTPVLFLDEPTRSLDPIMANKVRAVMSNTLVREYGITTVITSHQAAEVETLADRVALLKDGQIIACDEPSHLRRMMKDRVESIKIGFTGGNVDSKFFSTLKGLGGVIDAGLHDGMVEVTTQDLEDLMPRLLRAFEGEGLRVIHLESTRPSLEDTFRYLVKEEPA